MLALSPGKSLIGINRLTGFGQEPSKKSTVTFMETRIRALLRQITSLDGRSRIDP